MFSNRISRRVAIAGVALAMLGPVACGGSTKGAASPGGTTAPSACGIEALATARQPVNITFWHTMVRSTNDWLVSTIKTFNRTQHEVHVTLRQLPTYPDLFTKYKAGLSSGDLPDLAQFEDTTVQQLVDSKSTVPVQSCIDATKYDVSDYLPRPMHFYSVGGVQQSMPWAVSNIILMYNPALFAKAGLDPNKPPQTLEEVRQDSQQIVSSGAAPHGISLHAVSYLFEFLLAKSGGEFVNNGNGRVKRATAANLTGPTALKLWNWWDSMVRSGLALGTGSDLSNIDHLLALGTGTAAMTFEASGTIGPIEAVLQSGQYKGLKLATAPLPALTTGGGIPVGDGSLWISAKSSPEKRAAAWKLIQYLDSPSQQAALAEAGGYVPIRVSATKLPSLVKAWAKDPNYRTGYDQLTSGSIANANIGSLIGDYQGTRDAVRDGFVQMLSNKLSPQAAASLAEREANAKITDYNQRIGG